MRILRITSVVLAAVVVALFAYANLRQRSVTENLKRASLISFHLRGEPTGENRIALEKQISKTPGVAACSISREGNIASIVYHASEVSESTLAALFARETNAAVVKKEMATTGGCPVHAVGASFTSLITWLDVRSIGN